jgi:flagellin
MSKSIERLSSGFRVNRASDDPAGLVISEKLRAQIGGLGQAISNSQDAVNVVRTAEAALTEVHSILRSMRDLAVHASNTGATDEASRAADQAQIESAIDTLNRISESTQFGTRQLLDGSSGVNATISNSKIDSVVAGKDAPMGFVDMEITQAASKAALTTSNTASYTATSDVVDDGGIITINGTSISVEDTDTVQVVIDKINASGSGVTASFDTDHMVLTQNEFGADYKVDYNESTSIFNGATATSVSGTNVEADISYTIDGAAVTESVVGSGKQLKTTHDMIITVTDDAAASAATEENAIYVKNDSLKFQVGAFAGQNAEVSIQSTAANNLGITASGLNNKAWTVADIDVTTFEGAQDAMKLLDAAISEVSERRSDLGAFQKNILESNINSLSVAKENIAASESSIRDTDMASEMVTFTKNQILMQAGTSMLSQANQMPQNLLSLLR